MENDLLYEYMLQFAYSLNQDVNLTFNRVIEKLIDLHMYSSYSHEHV